MEDRQAGPVQSPGNGYGEASWASVKITHTFDKSSFRTIAAVTPYVGWYRRHIAVDLATIEEKQQEFIDFDGAFFASPVWVNGTLVGTHRGGYRGDGDAREGDRSPGRIRLQAMLEVSRYAQTSTRRTTTSPSLMARGRRGGIPWREGCPPGDASGPSFGEERPSGRLTC